MSVQRVLWIQVACGRKGGLSVCPFFSSSFFSFSFSCISRRRAKDTEPASVGGEETWNQGNGKQEVLVTGGGACRRETVFRGSERCASCGLVFALFF